MASVDNTFAQLGRQIRALRKTRSFTQLDLAARVGRDPARISELERDLLSGRSGRDRLTLVAELCEALGVVPVLLPPARAAALLAEGQDAPAPTRAAGRAFDDVFVDLSDGEG
jgi:transcriptional regulator with XRE-family HTH domain